MTSLRKSLAISFAEKYSTFFIQLISSLILARLLSPEEIGIYSVGVAVVGFAHLIRDFGISNYIVQEKNLTEQDIKSVLGLTMLLAWACAFLLFSSRNLIANFFEEPGLKEVITILSIGFIFIPFSSTILALLRRNLKFNQIFVITLASALINNSTALVLAFLGFGFSSLAWAGLLGTLSTVVFAIVFRPPESTLIPSLKVNRKFLSFGTYTFAAKTLIEIGQRAPELVIGKYLGFTSVGYYSRAEGFVGIFDRLITQAVRPVALPSFAKNQREGGSVQTAFVVSTSVLMGVAWPFGVALFFLAPVLIQIMYGEQWLTSIPLAQIMVFSLVLRVPSYLAGPILISSGYVRDYFIQSLIVQPLKLVLVLLALPFGLETITVVIVFSTAISSFIFIRLVYLRCNINIRDFLTAVALNLSISLMCTVPFLGLQYVTWGSELTEKMAAAMLALSIWILLIFKMNHPIAGEIAILVKNIRLIRR